MSDRFHSNQRRGLRKTLSFKDISTCWQNSGRMAVVCWLCWSQKTNEYFRAWRLDVDRQFKWSKQIFLGLYFLLDFVKNRHASYFVKLKSLCQFWNRKTFGDLDRFRGSEFLCFLNDKCKEISTLWRNLIISLFMQPYDLSFMTVKWCRLAFKRIENNCI